MFFSDWRMLLRRWYAVIIGFTLTAGLCFGVTTVVPPSYEIKAMMLVLPPSSSVGKGGNPFLALGGLGSVADVVSRAMMDGNTVKDLVALGADDSYLVIQDATSAGPVILITSSGHSPAESEKTLRIVKEQIPIKLLKLQQATQVPERSLITVNLLSQDEIPTVVRKSQFRATFLAFAVGIGLTLVLTGLLDGALLRRSRRRDGTDQIEEDEDFEPILPAASNGSHPNGAAHPVLANGVDRTRRSRSTDSPPNRQPARQVGRTPEFEQPVSARPQPAQAQPQAAPVAVPVLKSVRPAREDQPAAKPQRGNPGKPGAESPPTTPLPLDLSAWGHQQQQKAQAAGQSAAGQPAKNWNRQDEHGQDEHRRVAAVFDLDRLPAVFREPVKDQDGENIERPPKDGSSG